jgi:hypothetical protein
MKEVMVPVLSALYALVSIVTIVGYIPTIKDLWHYKKPSANLSSYGVWTITNAITFTYSMLVLPDMLFRIVSGVAFASCLTILSLCIWLKRRKFISLPEILTHKAEQKPLFTLLKRKKRNEQITLDLFFN